jgi:hypothetical protein
MPRETPGPHFRQLKRAVRFYVSQNKGTIGTIICARSLLGGFKYVNFSLLLINFVGIIISSVDQDH